ncbi:D-isomer specific 2-hydroxyacid dehydrogenase [Phanerochaete sordida]|uniref:D-isomer specific 2-hydroxyacid dehydrogenase n=1 Tax=Phanerochaete sordida TaxID=48140 RepID=A0A9P3L976_9APHY|nr:D-isomer specific 2-hydroxyacid dehydrogenase [Phanerochaete sordida]
MSLEPVKVAVLDDYQRVSHVFGDWSVLQGRVKVDTFIETLHDEDALAERLKPYTIVCAMRERTKFPASLLDRLPNLKLIATTGMRNAGIDVAHAKSKGILVCGTGSGGESTLEHIWALILGTARHITLEDAGVKARRQLWQSTVPVGLAGKTLGLVGVGRLGGQTAQIAKAFNMEVIGWSPHLTPDRAAQAGVTFIATKEELMRRSDIVSIHMVLSERTKSLITGDDLALMKPSALFINTSRGPIVDEQGLVQILQDKKIAGAGLDVFDVEPLPLDHPLRGLHNVTLSPHMGYVSDDNYKVFWSHTVENIKSFLDGEPKRVMS